MWELAKRGSRKIWRLESSSAGMRRCRGISLQVATLAREQMGGQKGDKLGGDEEAVGISELVDEARGLGRVAGIPRGGAVEPVGEKGFPGLAVWMEKAGDNLALECCDLDGGVNEIDATKCCF